MSLKFDTQPLPLLVPKGGVDYQFSFDQDYLTITKTIIERPALPRWPTIKEVYLREDDVTYEEVSPRPPTPSPTPTPTVHFLVDYLNWINCSKAVAAILCANGLLLQLTLLTIDYLSAETVLHVTPEDSSSSSSSSPLTICAPNQTFAGMSCRQRSGGSVGGDHSCSLLMDNNCLLVNLAKSDSFIELALNLSEESNNGFHECLLVSTSTDLEESSSDICLEVWMWSEGGEWQERRVLSRELLCGSIGGLFLFWFSILYFLCFLITLISKKLSSYN